MSFNPDKTEIMIFSNRSVPENLDFSFNELNFQLSHMLSFYVKGLGAKLYQMP
jgi:hypothetical protein